MKKQKSISLLMTVIMLLFTFSTNASISKAYTQDCNKDGVVNIGATTISGPHYTKIASASTCQQITYILRDYCRDCNISLGNNYTVVTGTTGHSAPGSRFTYCDGTRLHYENKCSTCFIVITSSTALCTRHPVHPE